MGSEFAFLGTFFLKSFAWNFGNKIPSTFGNNMLFGQPSTKFSFTLYLLKASILS